MKKKGCFIVAGICLLVLAIPITIGVLTDWGATGKPELPAYEEIECKIYDTGVKSQITRHIVLKDTTATSDQIKYLTEVMVSASNKTKMKYHNGIPTHIFIYIHKSKDSYDTGIWVNPIASYKKIGVDDPGQYTYQIPD